MVLFTTACLQLDVRREGRAEKWCVHKVCNLAKYFLRFTASLSRVPGILAASNRMRLDPLVVSVPNGIAAAQTNVCVL